MYAAMTAQPSSSRPRRRGGGNDTMPLTTPNLCATQWDKNIGANLQKKGGRWLDIGGIFEAVEKHRSRNNISIEIDKRDNNNGMSLNSSRHAFAREQAAAPPATGGGADGVAAKRLFFDPVEMRVAAENGFAPFFSTTLQAADTEAAAEHFINCGFIEFSSVILHNTRESGLANLPVLTADPSQGTERQAGQALLHDEPPPTGEVTCLPKNMPLLRTEGGGSCASKVIEAFEIKVVDEDNNKIWHPLRLWDKDTRKRCGYTDGSNFTTRLNAYYAAKCGEIEATRLMNMNFSDLKKEGKKEYGAKYGITRGSGPGYWIACLCASFVRGPR